MILDNMVESQTDLTNTGLTASRPSSRAWLARVGLALMLLIGSGGVRWWQAQRVDAALAAGRESPFPLDSLPKTLGNWVGSPAELDPRIVEATGSTDLIQRHFVDQRTGVAIDAILLYGPTTDIFIHKPELCYLKAGFTGVGDAPIRSISFPGGKAPFCSLIFTKGDPGRAEYQEVYYSWRYNGHWSSSVGSPKESERIPGMYKVMLTRKVAKGESRTVDNPCEAFLELLIPVLEARITGQAPLPSPSTPPV